MSHADHWISRYTDQNRLQNQRTSYFQMKVQLRLVPFITNSLPSKPIDISRWKIPPHIHMADPSFNTPGRVDMLLGADVFRCLQNGDMKLHQHLPPLRKTLFGWLIGGEVESLQEQSQNFVNFCGYIASHENQFAIAMTMTQMLSNNQNAT